MSSKGCSEEPGDWEGGVAVGSSTQVPASLFGFGRLESSGHHDWPLAVQPEKIETIRIWASVTRRLRLI